MTPPYALTDRPESAREPVRQFITFTLGEAEFGVDIMQVREIKGWRETTAVPNAPAFMRGVINLRGTIVPIFDLRARFGLGLTVPTGKHVVIIVAAGARIIGLLADAVSDIVAAGAAEIRPVPALASGTDSAYLEGLVEVEARMVTLISLAGLFPDINPVEGRSPEALAPP